MSTVDTMKPIVVAVDGSESARHAAAWAAQEARRRGRRLRVVHAYQWPLPAYGPVFVDSTVLRDAIRHNTAEFVRDAILAAEDAVPDIGPEAEVLRGPAVAVLRSVSNRPPCWCSARAGWAGSPGCWPDRSRWRWRRTGTARSS